MKYFELYLAALYDVLQTGGKQEVVDRAIAEVNNPTQAGLDDYLKTPPPIPCSVCSVPFALEDYKPALDEEVLCPSCKKTSLP